MNILKILLATAIATISYSFMYEMADEKSKDLFKWGYMTGAIITLILTIIL